jgi:hypothetical protein
MAMKPQWTFTVQSKMPLLLSNNRVGTYQIIMKVILVSRGRGEHDLIPPYTNIVPL